MVSVGWVGERALLSEERPDPQLCGCRCVGMRMNVRELSFRYAKFKIITIKVYCIKHNSHDANSRSTNIQPLQLPQNILGSNSIRNMRWIQCW